MLVAFTVVIAVSAKGRGANTDGQSLALKSRKWEVANFLRLGWVIRFEYIAYGIVYNFRVVKNYFFRLNSLSVSKCTPKTVGGGDGGGGGCWNTK